MRVSHSNEVQLGERKLDQCIRLSPADMDRNESLLIAASYFWSDALNAFVFGHDPASPTLTDVLMLTGLDVSTADSSHIFDTIVLRWKPALSAAGLDTFRSTVERGLLT